MVLKISDYKAFNPRLEGMKLIDEALAASVLPHIRTQEIRIVTYESFKYYKEHAELDPETVAQIRSEAEDLFKISDTGKLAVRRAYLVPGLQSPPGPYYLGLESVDAVVEGVKAIFDFAIKHDYDKDEGARIESFFYPFVDPPEFPIPLREGVDIPKGGYGYATDDEGRIIKVLAVWGNNDGVQSLGKFDEYTVDAMDMIIVKKEIPQKLYGLFLTPRSNDDKLAVPLDKQFKQVFNDMEILECAKMISECTRISGQQKVAEYQYDGKRISFQEVINRDIAEQEAYDDLVIEGTVFTISNEADIERFQQDPEGKIVYISKRIIEHRDYDTLNGVAALPGQLNVLYPGTTATAHAMRVLTDSGHRAFVVGDRPFKEHEKVQIVVSDGEITIHTGGGIAEHHIVPLAQAMNYPLEEVGGKAYNLSRLMAYGFTVPSGFVVSSKVMGQTQFFDDNEFIHFLHDLDETKLYSVRSSANVEDSKNNALAGQFETVINVKRQDIAKAIQTVWDSASTSHIKKVQETLDIPEILMGVVIQEMIQPQYAGVIFGANIQTKSINEVVAEINQGLAEDVVNGVANVMQVAFDKTTGNIKRTSGAELPIRDVMLSALFQMYMQAERAFEGMQDIEWTYDTDSVLYALQTRDLKI